MCSHFAVEKRRVDCILSLILTGADVNNGRTAFMKATSLGNLQHIEALLEKGADVNIFDSSGCNALYYAALKGNAEILQLILELGADVNKTHEKRKQYSLIAAASGGHGECVRILLEAGADVNHIDYENHSALSCSALYGQDKCVKLLIQAGADVNHTSKCGSVLHAAAREGVGSSYAVRRKSAAAAACIGHLIQAGADVNAVNSDNETALMLAAFANHRDSVKLLLQAGADVRLVNKTGFNTLSVYVVKNTLCQVSIVFEGMIRLLHAAGETRETVTEEMIDRLRGYYHQSFITNEDCMEIAREYLCEDAPTMCLKNICRRAIREHLQQMSRVNLFVRVPYLGLPPSLTKYLLYDVSLD